MKKIEINFGGFFLGTLILFCLATGNCGFCQPRDYVGEYIEKCR